jgi:hypothetical protein
MIKNITIGIFSIFLNCNAQTINDSIWIKKISYYKSTEDKYFRTKVRTDGASAISDITREQRKSIQTTGKSIDQYKVHEIVLSDFKDIIYSVGEKSYMNHKGIIGLSTNQYICQQFSPRYYLFNSSSKDGNEVIRSDGYYVELIPSKTELFDTVKNYIGDDEIYDIKTQKFTKMNLPQYNFVFDKILPFPYLRITTPKDLNDVFNPDNNSDFLYSMLNKEIYNPITQIIEARNKPITYSNSIHKLRTIRFASSQKYFKIGDYIYNISDGEQLELNIELGGDLEYRKYGVNYVLTFNDSIFIIGNHRTDDALTILNINNNSTYNLPLNKINKLDEFIFVEIDKFGKYLYLESENKLTIYDCQFNKISYQGPHVGIDYTTDKVGWIMTKTHLVNLYKDATPTTEDVLKITKSGFTWQTKNVYKKPSMGNQSWLNKTFIFQRSLIDLSNIIDTSFCMKLEKLVGAALPPSDIFTNNSNLENRRTKIYDSLINCSYTWHKTTANGNNRTCVSIFEPLLDSIFLDVANTYLIPKETNEPFVYPYVVEKGINRFSVEKKIDPESQFEFFKFHLEVDNIPSKYLYKNTSTVFYPIVCTKKEGFRSSFTGSEEFLNPSCLTIHNNLQTLCSDGEIRYMSISKNSKYYAHQNSNNLLGFIVIPDNSIKEINDSSSTFAFDVEIFNNEFAKGLWQEFSNNNSLDIEPLDDNGNVELKIAPHLIGTSALSHLKLELDLFETNPLMTNKKGSKKISAENLYINSLNSERKLWRYEYTLELLGNASHYMGTHFRELIEHTNPLNMFNSPYSNYLHDVVFYKYDLSHR